MKPKTPALVIATLLLFTTAILLVRTKPPEAVNTLKAVDGLEVTLWASEPQLRNPTNIDIDARGRIWVLEGVNYRRQLRGEPDIREGDRIVILEDTDGDGKADHRKIFDESPALRSPLGIAVLGNRVIVSQSPDLIVYTKDDNDRVLNREVLLTGWKGLDHDHGLHAVVFGHDGRYYFNSGDQGFDVTDRSGRRFVSSRQGPFYAGTALRIEPDGTRLTVLGHNFRNPYELALDSFGSIWQTDNDDDGNAWVRVNYVLEGGNFGYWGPGGKSWREDRGSHFHSELPGVVPNIARTGAGSPCGLLVYEGTLLPEKYRGQLIHAEAGKRLINTYFISKRGAGYTMSTEDTVTAADTWFRPSDVVAAPDGAVYFSDWYDASVGGHQMKDTDRGRIYRLAPAGYRAQTPAVDLQSEAGRSAALRSPAQSVRYLAHTKLREMGAAAQPELHSMWKQGDDVLRARALWLLAALGGGAEAVQEALRHENPSFRILGLRVLRASGGDFVAAAGRLLEDPAPEVRREIASMLRDAPDEPAAHYLVELARQYDGKDRWYLEALGIGARGREKLLYSRLRQAFPGTWNSTLGQLLWEIRPADALPYLVASLHNPALSVSQRSEALAALSAMPSEAAGAATARLARNGIPDELRDLAFERLSRQLFSEWIPLRTHPEVRAAIRTALGTPALQPKALELTEELGDREYGPQLLAIAKSSSASEESRGLAIQALGKTGDSRYLPELETLSQTGSVPLRAMAIRAIGSANPPGLDVRMRSLILSDAPNEMRAEAVRILGRSEPGVTLLLDLEERAELPAELRNVATLVANASRQPAIRARAQKLLPPFAGKNRNPLPPARQILRAEGDATRGRKIFADAAGARCNSCHTLGESRKLAGPDLSAIGSKLGKEALLDAILNPSAGIAPEFHVWILETKSQGEVIGVLGEDTPQRVVVRTEAGEEIRLSPSEITARRQSRMSMMPEDLVNSMTEQDLVDLLAFLSTLQGTRAAR